MKAAVTFLTYLRAILLLIFGVILTFLMALVVLFCVFVLRSKRALDYVIVYWWSLPLVHAAGVEVEVRGLDLVRTTGQGVLILFNHSSMWDIPVLYGYFPRPFRFGAKIELFKIPLFGAAMRASGVLPIDRASRNKVMRVYDEAITRINQGHCFALAPEGTRQDAFALGRFKRGPFEFAINAKMDIVPVVLAGILEVLPKHSAWINVGKWRRKVIMEITPPVKASEYTMETVEDLQARVRAQMEPLFQSLGRELNVAENPS